MLCRAYTNAMDKKALTAEKILGNVQGLLEMIESGSLEIITFPKFRAGSKPYDFFHLKKKFLM